MTKDQARGIVETVTGVKVDEHPKALDIAWELGNSLIAAVRALDPEWGYSDEGSR